VPLGMNVFCCPFKAAMATSVATARRAALSMWRLYSRRSGHPLLRSWQMLRVNLNLWPERVCIEAPLTRRSAARAGRIGLGSYDPLLIAAEIRAKKVQEAPNFVIGVSSSGLPLATSYGQKLTCSRRARGISLEQFPVAVSG